MSRVRWSLVVLWLVACGAPENRNPSRCDAKRACPADLMCYRGYCIADDDPPDIALDPDAQGDGTTASPSPIRDAGADNDGAASSEGDALSGASGDAGSAQSEDAAGEDATSSPATAPAQPPASAPSEPTAPPATPPSTPAPAEPAPSTPPAMMPSTPPAMTPSTPPANEPPKPSSSEGANFIIGLISAGLAPVAMLSCVPSCALGVAERDCQRCVQKVLKQGYGDDACDASDDDDKDDDKRARAPKEACALLTCASKNCGDDT